MNEQKKTMTQETQNREDFIMLPTVDFCFKELMQNAKVRQGMIAALLGVEPEEIEETILLPTILHPEYPDDKYGILDVKVVLKNGSQMDFEMQVTAVSYWTKRILFYLGKMYTDQLKAGESYEKLKKCIHVGILNFIHFPDDDRCYRKIIFCDKDTGEEYTDLLEIHVLELKKLPEKEIKERVDNIIKLMGLEEFRNSYPHQLSVSTEQRIIIGRAFAMNPDLLLMDEPYGQMDIKLRFYLEDEVLKLWKETGATVVFITHNIEEAVYLAERVLILTNKPTTIKEDLKIDLPRPRDVTSPEFIKIRQYVTDQIKWW